jgi:hypothetical protein
MKYLTFVLLILIPFSGLTQNHQAIISGTVKNLIDESYVENAWVRFCYRKFSENMDGTISLKPIKTCTIEQSIQTDANGYFELDFPLRSEKDILCLDIYSEGRETLTKTYIPIGSGDNIWFDFKMTPSNPTPDEELLIDQLTANERLAKDNARQLDEANARVLQNNAPALKTGCSYSVPDSVYVSNLINGYNGSATGAGFTGYIDFDDYVAGVVQGELGGITTNVDVKKAQAVGARTYSMNRHLLGLPVNVGQAYHDTPNATAIQGAQQTSQEVILYNGTVIDAKYSARCNGDYTQHANEGTWAPYTNCNLTGNVIPYLLSRPCSGHPSCGSTTESPCCNVTISTSGVSGHIFGHGVGMCQRGIEQWGEIHGLDYCEMLHKYYTGICIANSNCADSTATLNCDNAVPLTCGQIYSGPSSSDASNIDSYACNNWTETGPERVHTFTPSYNGVFNVIISNFTGDLDVYILESCDPDDCVGIVNSSDASFANGVAGHTYYIVVDADDGSGSAYDIVVDCPLLGISENKVLNAVEIYPNPSSGIIQLNYGQAIVEEIVLFNYDGQIIKRIANPSAQMDLTNLSSGIYFIQLLDAKKNAIVKKIVRN